MDASIEGRSETNPLFSISKWSAALWNTTNIGIPGLVYLLFQVMYLFAFRVERPPPLIGYTWGGTLISDFETHPDTA